MELVKIIHAETNPLIREGIKVLLANEELDFDIKGVDSKDELNNLLESTSSNFLIFGYGLTSEFNKQLLKEVKLNFPHIKILIIASDLSKSQILQLLDFEIDGYLTNKCDLTEIKNAIRAIIKNDKFFCNTVINILLEKQKPEENCYPSKLSDREIEITKLIASGLTSKQMAAKLFLSTHTINTHRKNIMKKIGVKGASEVTLYAINEGLVEPK
jgi:two-component system response regulator NreC